MKRFVVFVLCFISWFLFEGYTVKAYSGVCDEGNILSIKGEYELCGNSNIYLMNDNRKHSSYLVAEVNVDYKKGKLVYAGNIDGIDTFYSTGFNYYGVIYDERNPFKTEDNVWSDISIDGIEVYSGKINDLLLVDQSKRGFVAYYNESGAYLIRQYIGVELQNAIKVIVVNKKDMDLSVNSIVLGNHYLENKGILPYGNFDLVIKIGGGKYGFANKVELSLNNCNIITQFKKKMIIDKSEIINCLIPNENNRLLLTMSDGLGRSKIYDYSFKLSSEKVSIKLEDNISESVTASRRVLIKANAGLGNDLDESYALYYWSTSASDGLTVEEFLRNYELSKNRGSYSSDTGVILRGNEGVYYLYAMAKDDDSAIVVKSEQYILKKNDRISKFLIEDVILVLGLCLCAVSPIIAYLFIREKDTD